MEKTVTPMLLDLRETVQLVGVVSKSTWQALVRRGKAPQPRLISGRRVGWLRSDLEAFVAGLPVSDLPPPKNTGARK